MMIRTSEEEAAATAVAALSGNSWKRSREGEEVSFEKPAKIAKTVANTSKASKESNKQNRELRPAPFFFYRDFSKHVDPDPLTPLTPPGRVPNFPAKMHAILSRADLADVVAWMPHGRSWRVLKPREFEVRVIPTYFEHSKFSSFIRQANGWGFRRITQGRDRNSYYHELFLRGLPHLCKQMKRPGVAEKAAADAEHEPDFYKITEAHPVPEKAEDDSIMLPCTMEGGPKARMPIYSGARLSAESIKMIHKRDCVDGQQAYPASRTTFVAFNNAVNMAENQVLMSAQKGASTAIAAPAPAYHVPQQALVAPPAAAATTASIAVPRIDSRVTCLAAADRLAFALQPAPAPAAYPTNTAASQFAAGFAAATALNSSHIRNVLGQALVLNHIPASPQSKGPIHNVQLHAGNGHQ